MTSATVFCASNRSAYITGTVLPVGCGVVAEQMGNTIEAGKTQKLIPLPSFMTETSEERFCCLSRED